MNRYTEPSCCTIKPFRIYWHGKFLRAYNTKSDMLNGVKFFTAFLLNITYKQVKGNSNDS